MELWYVKNIDKICFHNDEPVKNFMKKFCKSKPDVTKTYKQIK